MHISLKKEIKQSGAGKTGVALLILVIMVAVLAPVLSRYSPEQSSTASPLSPSSSHWLGTNQVGQDIWSQLLYGARTSLSVGFGVGILSLVLSVIFGVSAALVGGLYLNDECLPVKIALFNQTLYGISVIPGHGLRP